MVKPNPDATSGARSGSMATEPRGNVSAMATKAYAGHKVRPVPVARIAPAHGRFQTRGLNAALCGQDKNKRRLQLGGPPGCFGSKSHANGLYK
jgi:hypothetical protein